VSFTVTPLLLIDISLRSVFLQQRDWDWSASICSYDADGSEVWHSVVRQSSTILLMPSQWRNGTNQLAKEAESI
jgi:hypothetical protein